ncbi:MAG: hypothetical protein Unbinned5336contig1001_23 [Prokaryotic dsDNA virus sp.]|nr:MAG: hypothetical protein Unbinned5336contig1001_23 [Prokaryotic dsDNA virus sp.]|tara:strand:- start:742 stop:987 length:246 start_codon:yes stop_codon:yes gene_type:complete
MSKEIDPLISKELRFIKREINSLRNAIADIEEEPTPSFLRLVETAPTASAYPGKPGDVAYDASTLYVCVASNTWKKVTIAW